MKKSYILLTLALGFAASACQNSGWEDDIYTGYTIWNKSLQQAGSQTTEKRFG